MWAAGELRPLSGLSRIPNPLQMFAAGRRDGTGLRVVRKPDDLAEVSQRNYEVRKFDPACPGSVGPTAH